MAIGPATDRRAGGAELSRTVRVGLSTSAGTIALLVAYPFLPGHGRVAVPVYLGLLGAATATVAALTPFHRRLFAGRRGYRLIYAWSLLDIGLVSAGVAVSGGPSSPLYLCYALTSLFVTSCYPRRAQLVTLSVTVAAYLATLVATGARLLPGPLSLRLGMIVLVYLLGASIAEDKDRAAAESDRRAALLGTVASVAREMSGADRQTVLEAVLSATAELGFEYAHVSMLEADGPRARVLLARGVPEETLAAVFSAGQLGIAGLVRAAGSTVWLADYPAEAEAIPAMVAAGVTGAVASPVRVDGELVGVLAAATCRDRTLSAGDREAFELLAAVASRAFEGARRFEALAASEARMRHMALHDDLTGLANRALFHERLDEALARPPAAPGAAPVGCMVFDLDDFKRVNDTLGHGAGDALLVEVARRAQGCLRRDDLLARLSGDEFGILTTGLEPDVLERLAARLLAALAAPVALGGRQVAVRASLGLATARAGVPEAAPADRAVLADRLLTEADVAMYEAKRAGKGRFVRFDQTMRQRMVSRVALEEELRAAVDAGELSVVYQPIVELRAGALTGFEALVRWDSRRLGPVPPAEFIPVAEQIGAIGAIGRFVLRRACEDLQALRRANGAWSDLSMSVNLSTRQLTDPRLVEDVLGVLAETWTPSWCLTLEITESALLEDAALGEARLEALAGLGVSVALDDFGTGYSSLSYLRQLKVHTLKVDRSFVQDLERGPAAAALVRGIVHLATALGLSTVAEGVETAGQLRMLRELGCHRAQGFLLARPLPADDLVGYVASTRVLGAGAPAADEPDDAVTGPSARAGLPPAPG